MGCVGGGVSPHGQKGGRSALMGRGRGEAAGGSERGKGDGAEGRS